eukprot:UN00689
MDNKDIPKLIDSPKGSVSPTCSSHNSSSNNITNNISFLNPALQNGLNTLNLNQNNKNNSGESLLMGGTFGNVNSLITENEKSDNPDDFKKVGKSES